MCSKAMWDVLLTSEVEAKKIAGTVLKAKSVRLVTEYMGARKTRVTLHGVPLDISEDRLGDSFAQCGPNFN